MGGPFAKQCPKCDHVFRSLEEFVQRDPYSIGLAEMAKGSDRAVVGLYGQCVCGWNLVILCKDCREMTEAGIERRMTFGQLLENLKASGVEESVARQVLLTILHGEGGDLAKKFLNL